VHKKEGRIKGKKGIRGEVVREEERRGAEGEKGEGSKRRIS
jgi:hypothetical protein